MFTVCEKVFWRATWCSVLFVMFTVCEKVLGDDVVLGNTSKKIVLLALPLTLELLGKFQVWIFSSH